MEQKKLVVEYNKTMGHQSGLSNKTPMEMYPTSLAPPSASSSAKDSRATIIAENTHTSNANSRNTKHVTSSASNASGSENFQDKGRASRASSRSRPIVTEFLHDYSERNTKADSLVSISLQQ